MSNLESIRGMNVTDVQYNAERIALVFHDPERGHDITIAIDAGTSGAAMGGVTIPPLTVSRYEGRISFDDLEYMV